MTPLNFAGALVKAAVLFYTRSHRLPFDNFDLWACGKHKHDPGREGDPGQEYQKKGWRIIIIARNWRCDTVKNSENILSSAADCSKLKRR